MATVKTANQPVSHSAPQKTPSGRKPAWQAVFASEEEYDKSVASVVARIKSGEVQPRVPDEE